MLIEAAGHLMALKSNPKRVSLREILELSKVEKAKAQSLFKSKSKLFEAVYREICRMYERDIIREYYESHRGMLATRRGQALFLSGLVDVFDSFFESMRGTWHEALCKSISRRNPEFIGFNLCRQFERNMASWCEIFEAIKGYCDIFQACAKYTGVIMPIALKFFCDESRLYSNSKNLDAENAEFDLQNQGLNLQYIKESLILDFGLEGLRFECARN